MKREKITGGVAIVAVVCGGLALLVCRPTNTVCPVLLVPGFGGSAAAWVEAQNPTFTGGAEGIAYAGDLTATSAGIVLAAGAAPVGRIPYPCYTMNLAADGCEAFTASAAELAQFIRFVRRRHGAEQVALVGFGSGGIVCREYLTSPLYRTDVRLLVTVRSPHLGTDVAYLHDLNCDLRARLRTLELAPVRAALAELLSTVNQAARRQNLPLTAAALGMLHPPAAGNYLDELNRRPHPAAVRYACVVAAPEAPTLSFKPVLSRLEALLSDRPDATALSPVLLDFSACLLGFGGGETVAGDSLSAGRLVSAESQDLRQASFFADGSVPVQVVRIPCGELGTELQRQLVCLVLGQPGREPSLCRTPGGLAGRSLCPSATAPHGRPR